MEVLPDWSLSVTSQLLLVRLKFWVRLKINLQLILLLVIFQASSTSEQRDRSAKTNHYTAKHWGQSNHSIEHRLCYIWPIDLFIFSIPRYGWELHTGEVLCSINTIIKRKHRSKKSTEAKLITFVHISPVIFGLLSWLIFLQRDIVKNYIVVKFCGLKTPSPRVRLTNRNQLRAALNNWGVKQPVYSA